MAKILSSRRRGSATNRGAVEIITFANAVRFLYDRVDVERMRVVRANQGLFKLDRMRGLLAALGNPH